MKRIIISSILLVACLAAKAQGGVALGQNHNEPVVDKVVAVVGKNIVKLSDIENGYVSLRIKQGYDNAFQNRCNILEGLLINKLLVHKGEVDSVEVTDEAALGFRTVGLRPDYYEAPRENALLMKYERREVC